MTEMRNLSPPNSPNLAKQLKNGGKMELKKMSVEELRKTLLLEVQGDSGGYDGWLEAFDEAIHRLALKDADLLLERERAEKAENNYQFMVDRAADEKLDGYRELGAKCASLEE